MKVKNQKNTQAMKTTNRSEEKVLGTTLIKRSKEYKTKLKQK
jgi:hypothetical protein